MSQECLRKILQITSVDILFENKDIPGRRLKYFHEPNVRRIQVLMDGVKGKTDKIRRNNVIDK